MNKQATINRLSTVPLAFHEDDGHGWLFVPAATLEAFGFAAHHFSGYSYGSLRDRVTGGLFLEEDIDAGTFIARFRLLTGAPPIIQTTRHRGRAFVRDLPHNADGWPSMDAVTNWPAVSHGALPEFRYSRAEIWSMQHGYATTQPADGITHD